jgi:hypothetical protein
MWVFARGPLPRVAAGAAFGSLSALSREAAQFGDSLVQGRRGRLGGAVAQTPGLPRRRGRGCRRRGPPRPPVEPRRPHHHLRGPSRPRLRSRLHHKRLRTIYTQAELRSRRAAVYRRVSFCPVTGVLMFADFLAYLALVLAAQRLKSDLLVPRLGLVGGAVSPDRHRGIQFDVNAVSDAKPGRRNDVALAPAQHAGSETMLSGPSSELMNQRCAPLSMTCQLQYCGTRFRNIPGVRSATRRIALMEYVRLWWCLTVEVQLR